MQNRIFGLFIFASFLGSAIANDLATVVGRLSTIAAQDSEISVKDTNFLLDVMNADNTGIPLIAGVILEPRIHDPGVRTILLKEFESNRTTSAKSVIAGLILQGGADPKAENYLSELLASQERNERHIGLVGFGLTGNACFRLKTSVKRVLMGADQLDANQCLYAFQLLGRSGARYERQLLEAGIAAIQAGKNGVAALILSSMTNFAERSPETLTALIDIAKKEAYPEDLRFTAMNSLAFSSKAHSELISKILGELRFRNDSLEKERKRIQESVQRFGTLQTHFDLGAVLRDI